MSELLRRISEERERRPAKWRLIADFILKNSHGVASMRMVDIRRELSVSDGSIVNFVKSLGCEGFAQFKALMAQAESRITDSRAMASAESGAIAGIAEEVKEAMDELVRQVDAELIRQIAAAIVGARRLVVVGRETSASIAEIFSGYLLMLGVAAFVVKEPNAIRRMARTMGKGDVLLAISYSGATGDTVSGAATAKECGATVCSVTAFGGSRLVELSDICAVIPSREARRGDFPVVARLTQLALADAICAEVAELTKKSQ